MFVDVHAHLDFKDFEKDLDDVIKRAKLAEVSHIICSGTNNNSNKRVLEISKKYDIVHASFGLYPLDILDGSLEEGIDFILKNKNKCVGIGEVGLDFVSREKEKEQRENFLKIMELVEKIKKPIIVHSRKAEKECIEMLESSKIKNVLMHCFSGNMKLVKRVEDNGWFFSVPCIIDFSHHFQTLVERVSINKVLTETDSPYLNYVKGERNEPKNVVHTVKKIAEIKKMNLDETGKIILSNFQKLFL